MDKSCSPQNILQLLSQTSAALDLDSVFCALHPEYTTCYFRPVPYNTHMVSLDDTKMNKAFSVSEYHVRNRDFQIQAASLSTRIVVYYCLFCNFELNTLVCCLTSMAKN